MGPPWVPMGPHGSPWVPMGPMGPHGSLGGAAPPRHPKKKKHFEPYLGRINPIFRIFSGVRNSNLATIWLYLLYRYGLYRKYFFIEVDPGIPWA